MKYLSVAEIAQKWGVSERTVRNYCACGKIPGAVLSGKTWLVPTDAQKPTRQSKVSLFEVLSREKAAKMPSGIYHKVQVELTYNSNRIEGSRLTHEQTRFIFETNTLGAQNGVINLDDVIETANHFRCIDFCIDKAKSALSENFVKTLHRLLKTGTSDSAKDWFNVGQYKKLPNEVGGKQTTLPEKVSAAMQKLLHDYNATPHKTLESIVEFHVKFERIHPFQDGNGRVGRLIAFKECLKHGVVPFIIDDELKIFYYRGLNEWDNERSYLLETCRAAQDKFRAWMNYFRIE